jgi:hypothetical protein
MNIEAAHKIFVKLSPIYYSLRTVTSLIKILSPIQIRYFKKKKTYPYRVNVMDNSKMGITSPRDYFSTLFPDTLKADNSNSLLPRLSFPSIIGNNEKVMVP